MISILSVTLTVLVCSFILFFIYRKLHDKVLPSTATKTADPEPQAALKRLCKDCKHFDLDEGQAVMRAHPMFAAAAQHVTPRQMATRRDEEGNVISGDGVPHKASWADFGACETHSELRWGEDGCEFFEAKV